MSSASKSYVATFEQFGKTDIAIVGGKIANLGELRRAEIPVPPGFGVTVEAFSHFLDYNNLRESLVRIFADTDCTREVDADRLAEEARSLLTAASMPPQVAADIKQAYNDLGKGFVAIRSSATAEDLPDASFAGQQDTFLNIIGEDDVVAYVQACWVSLYTGRAVYYRAKNNIDQTTVGIGVAVQKMAQADRSGTMFTLNPVSGETGEVVIEAAYGLGEMVVQGLVNPDYYRVAKETLAILEKVHNRQEEMMVKADNGSGTTIRKIFPPKSDLPKLTDAQAIELAHIGLRVAEHYGSAQDIEWALEDGRFYLTQSRPVTTNKLHIAEEAAVLETAALLASGLGASSGVTSGIVRIIEEYSQIHRVEEGDILVTRMTTPDFVPAMERAAAVVTEVGGMNCHAVIVSRELELPCVVGVANVMSILKDGQLVTVDGSHGKIFEGEARSSLEWEKRRSNLLLQKATEMVSVKTRTKLGVICANPKTAMKVARGNVDLVNLLRAEIMLARIGKHPRQFLEEGKPEEFTKQLIEGITTFCEAFGDRPVVYRLTDFKTNEYKNLVGSSNFEKEEENPMLGFRGALRFLEDEEVFKMEVDALVAVTSHHKNLVVMIPFVRTVDEARSVIALMERFGLSRKNGVKIWMMVEVPTNAILLDDYIDCGLDGVSIGSNDLLQLTLGVDRENSRLKHYDERDAAVMALIEMTIKKAKARNVYVSICGQAPSNFPEITEKLVEWGIDSIGVDVNKVDVTRELIQRVEQKLDDAMTHD